MSLTEVIDGTRKAVDADPHNAAVSFSVENVLKPGTRTLMLGTSAEKAMVFTITRPESAFDAGAQSHRGARGLMQLMPETAQRTAKRFGVPFAADPVPEAARRRLVVRPTCSGRATAAVCAAAVPS